MMYRSQADFTYDLNDHKTDNKLIFTGKSPKFSNHSISLSLVIYFMVPLSFIRVTCTSVMAETQQIQGTRLYLSAFHVSTIFKLQC